MAGSKRRFAAHSQPRERLGWTGSPRFPAFISAVGLLLILACLGGASALAGEPSAQLPGEPPVADPEAPAWLRDSMITPPDLAAQIEAGRDSEAERSPAPAEIEASRTAFRDLTAVQAAEAAVREFPQLINVPIDPAPDFKEGERITSYPTPYTARVDLPTGERAVIESLLPLVSTTSDGTQVPVDLSLREADGVLEPKHPIVPIRVSRQLDEGFEIPSIGLTLTPTESSGAPLQGTSTVEGAVVHFANTQLDSDTIVKPVPLGLQTHSILRSPASPERLYFRVEVEGDEDATLTRLDDGSIAVEAAGRTVTAIPPAIASDAAGADVPVSMEIDDDLLVLVLDHRSGGFRYPIDVDPTAVDFDGFGSWEGQGNWVYETNAPSVLSGAWNTTWSRLEVDNNGQPFQYGDFGAWFYVTQGVSRIYEFDATVGSPSGGNFLGIIGPSGVEAETWIPPSWPPVESSPVLCAGSGCSSSGGSAGNAALFELIAVTSGSFPIFARLNSATVKIAQDQAASITFNTTDPQINGKPNALYQGGQWVKTSDDARVAFSATDPGLGISYASLTSPDYGGWGGKSWGSVGGCVGIQCDSSYSKTASVGNLGEGEKRITASVSNAAIGAEATKYVKVDNSGPTATLSGLESGAVAGLGQNKLTIKVTDGTEQKPGSGVLAGETSVALDGEEILTPGGGSCSPGPCTITRNYSFVGQEIGVGEHILAVTAVDQIGNESTTELPIVVLSSGPTVGMGPGQLNIENGNFLHTATDVAVSTPGAQLRVMRTHESVRSLQQAGPLGPGWDLTLGAWRRATKMPDGSVVLTDSKGRLIIFQKDGSVYDAPPEYSGWKLSYDSTKERFTLTGPNRGSTVFHRPYGGPESLYSPFLTKNPDGEVALFQFDSYSSGFLKHEVLGSETCIAELGEPCKYLHFLYDSTTTATGDAPEDWGDYAGRLSGVKLLSSSSEGGGYEFDETILVEYAYDAEGRLRAVWDPRISPALKTTYGYDAAGHVIAVTPPGQQPWLLNYGKTPQTNYKAALLSAFHPSADAELGGDPPESTEAPHFGDDYPHPSVAYHVWSGKWDGDPAGYNYVWEKCDEEGKDCAPVPGATDQSYTPEIADLGATLRAAVTASNGSGTTTVATELSAPVEPPPAPEFDLEFGSFGTGLEQFKLLGGIALDAAGNVWVTDTGNNRIAKYSSEGKFLTAFGSKGTDNGQLESPRGIVINPVSGNVVVADTGNDRIQEFTPAGGFVKAWGSSGKGNGQFDEPGHLSARKFPGGKVLIYVSDTGNDRVQAFLANGTYTAQAGSSGSGLGQLNSPQGVSVIDAPWFVADSGNNRIQEFSETKFIKTIGSSGTGPGQFTAPLATAVEPNVGGLLVTETGGGQRVQKLAFNGDYVDTFDPGGLAGGKLNWPHGIAVEEFGPTYVIDGDPSISKARVSKWMPAEASEESPPPSSPPLGSAVWSIVYDVPLEGAETLDPSAAEAVWGQQDLPSAATAVFPPDEVPSSQSPSSYKRATVYYMDDAGRIVNTQAPGDRVSTEEYDQFGNVTRTLTPENRVRVLDAEGGQKTLSEQLDARLTYSGDGSTLLSVLGPKHEVELENGEEVEARLSTKYVYDEGAPKSGGPYGLVTKQTEAALVGEAEHDVRTKTFGYDGQGGLGWQLRKPTSETVDPGGLNLTSRMLYDADTGAVIETRMPANPAGGDAHAMQIIYYTDGESEVEECGERPELAGLVCQTRPAAQPETLGLPDLPVTTTAYNVHGQPTVTTEVVGEAVRTATIEYDAAGRPLSASISATSGKPVPTVHTTYDEANGMPTVQSTETEAIVSKYDSLGLLTDYTDADGNTSTYAYDIVGRVTEVDDGKGTQTFSYDETTGDLAKVEDSEVGDFGAEYDAGGKMTSMTYPGGLEARYTYDSGGTATALEYVDTTECSEDCIWFGDNAMPSIHGETLSQAGTRASFDYSYDDAGRLVEVEETPQGEGCTTRLYAYDADTNRTAATTRKPVGGGGACAESGGETQTTAFDEADRLVGEGVAYDNFGNVTNLPGAYAGGKALSSTYYVDDSAASLTQDGTTIEYMLDPAGRERESVSVDGESETQLISHFTGGGDSPAWTEDDSGNWTRYIGGMGGLAAIQTYAEGIDLQIADLHGDIVATTSPSEEVEGLDFIDESTEYGVPQEGAPAKYSWLGSAQRPVELESGVVAMGARTYVPQLGRFLQTDPVSGGSANAYAYVFGNPVGESDPTGEYTPGQAPPWLREVMENPPGMPPPPPPPPQEAALLEEELFADTFSSGASTSTASISVGPIVCSFNPGRPHHSRHNPGRINAVTAIRCIGGPVYGYIRTRLYRNGFLVADSGRLDFNFIDGHNQAKAFANISCGPGSYRATSEVVFNYPSNYTPQRDRRYRFSATVDNPCG